MTAARIAFVDHAPFVGGAETVLLDVIVRLDPARFDPTVFVPAASPWSKSLDARGVAWRNLPMPHLNAPSPLTPWRWLVAARRLDRVARQERIDLIHANTVRAHLVSAFARSAPVVWMLHDDTFPRRLFNVLRRRPARLIANSHATARHYGLERDPRAVVVHNGIDPQAAPGDRAAFRQRFSVASHTIVIGHIGRLARWKGQDVFIRAAARVAPTFPDARFMLIGGYTAGDDRGVLGGGESYRAELQRLAETTGLGDRLIFAGHQDNMADAYAGIDALVHSSTRPEPFGMVILEAMNAGVPVIASAHGGPLEIVEDGVSGLLTSPGDVDSLAEAMTTLLTDASRRRSLGEAARRRARERFDIRHQVEAIQSIYLDVLKRRRDTDKHG